MLTEQTPLPGLSTILWRISLPFFVFTFVLSILMAVSWTFLLPRYTRIDVAGTLRDGRELRAYRAELTAQIALKENERRKEVLAIHDPQYDAVKAMRLARIPLDELRAQLIAHAKKVANADDVVSLTSFIYDPTAKSLTIGGDVRAGTRSMTVLADFSQTLKTLPFVAKTTTPSFGREEDKNGFHSPFTITLNLR